MDYMDPDVRCPRKAVKLNHSLTHSIARRKSVLWFQKYVLWSSGQVTKTLHNYRYRQFQISSDGKTCPVVSELCFPQGLDTGGTGFDSLRSLGKSL